MLASNPVYKNCLPWPKTVAILYCGSASQLLKFVHPQLSLLHRIRIKMSNCSLANIGSAPQRDPEAVNHRSAEISKLPISQIRGKRFSIKMVMRKWPKLLWEDKTQRQIWSLVQDVAEGGLQPRTWMALEQSVCKTSLDQVDTIDMKRALCEGRACSR